VRLVRLGRVRWGAAALWPLRGRRARRDRRNRRPERRRGAILCVAKEDLCLGGGVSAGGADGRAGAERHGEPPLPGVAATAAATAAAAFTEEGEESAGKGVGPAAGYFKDAV